MAAIPGRALALVLALICALPAGAQDEARALATGDEGKPWQAVGRIRIAGTGYCTGTLIAPDLVLTAAHCLYHPTSGALVADTALEFAAGLRNGRAEAFRNVRRSVLHPDYVYEGRDKVGRVAYDLALLELDRPIRAADIRPLGTGNPPSVGDRVDLVFYATGSDEVPQLEQGCGVTGRQNRVTMIACGVNFGASGAPVLGRGETGPAIVSVVSAKAESDGRMVALATDLGPEVERLRHDLAGSDGVFGRASPVVRAPPGNGTAAGGGARFLRP